MKDILSYTVRFKKLLLRDYGIFLGSNELDFNHHHTLIIGNCGTGKTTIVNALAKLGPARGMKPHFRAENPVMTVEVFTEGNRDLIKKNSSVIFLSCETTELLPFSKKKPVTDIINHQNSEAIKTEAREYFKIMLSRKLGRIDSHKDLNPYIMAAGERICLNYAYAFAVRKVLNLDLPVVLDSPYSRLDTMLRNAVREFLKEQPCQQIMFGCEHEFDEEDKPHYILDYRNGYSKIVKNG